MVNLMEGVMYVGSAAILYHGITQQNVLSDENVRYGTAGALLGMVLGPKLEDIIRSDSSLTPEVKQALNNTIAGAVIGGGAGYILSKGAATYLKDQLGGLMSSKTVKNEP